jgi:DNA-binding response OmpR family regulator
MGMSATINLTKAHVLILERSPHAYEILAQILRGFGVGALTHSTSIEHAEKAVRRSEFDFILVDPNLGGEDGFAFVQRLRRSKLEANCCAPAIMISGHAPGSGVARARDAGANFFVVKPVTPAALLDRIQWLARDKREFIDAGAAYCGPNRRFKFEGPPAGSSGRRAEDRGDPLGAANEPNLSQDEIGSMIKAQRVYI